MLEMYTIEQPFFNITECLTKKDIKQRYGEILKVIKIQDVTIHVGQDYISKLITLENNINIFDYADSFLTPTDYNATDCIHCEKLENAVCDKPLTYYGRITTKDGILVGFVPIHEVF